MKITHEGTQEVKEANLITLMNDYENFQMKSSELIQDIFTRFTNIMKKAHGIEKGAPQGGTDMQCPLSPYI